MENDEQKERKIFTLDDEIMENDVQKERKIFITGYTFTDHNGDSLRIEEEIDGDGYCVSIMNPKESANYRVCTMRLSRDAWNKLHGLHYKF